MVTNHSNHCDHSYITTVTAVTIATTKQRQSNTFTLLQLLQTIRPKSHIIIITIKFKYLCNSFVVCFKKHNLGQKMGHKIGNLQKIFDCI